MGRDTLKEIEIIHDLYKKQWLSGEYNSMDDLMVDLLNELEDIYNPNRLNGN